MSATIGDFYQRVSRAIRRSTKYDDDIPDYAADAVRELENLQNWKYMWEEISAALTISASVNTLDLTGVPSADSGSVKSVRFIKFVADAGNQIPVRKTQRENVSSIASGRPGAYWMQTKDVIGFDAYPDQAYTYNMGLYRYSARPLVDSLAWLTMGEDLLIARTIRKMQPILRDNNLIQRWGEIENSTMPALLEAEVVNEYDSNDDQPTPFALEIEEDAAEEAEFS